MPDRLPSKRERTRARPSRSAADNRLLFTGVFFTFAPIGPLMMMTGFTPPNWLGGVVAAVISGLIGVGWSATFVFKKYWMIIPMIIIPMVVPWQVFSYLARRGMFDVDASVNVQSRLSILAIMAVAMLATGYVFTIRFVRRIESTAARARAELDLAKQIHESVVPPVSLRTSRVEVFGRSDPSSEMGGDLIDAIERPAGVDIYLADVSGHGVGAGIVMGMVKSAIRMCLRNEPPLESLVTDLNAVLTDLTRPNMFATFACLRIPVDGPIQYALAGHLPILHAIASSGEVREIPNQHLPLGITFDENYLSGTLTALPGDTFAILTDGLTEVQNADGKELGFASIRETFRANGSRSLPELHDAVVAAARAHGPQLDDQSLVLVRVLRPEPRP